MRAKLAVGVAALAILSGCGDGAGDAEQLGYVLLDMEAQQAGFVLDGMTNSRLPMSVADDEVAVLKGPGDSERTLQPSAGELLYVRGDNGTVARFTLGQEVTPDAVYVVGDEDSAEALSELADDAEVLRAEDGWFQLAGREALLLLADGAAPAGLQEVIPVEPLGTAEPDEETAQGAALIATPAMRKLSLAGALGTPRLKFGEASALSGSSLLKRKVACEDPVEGLWVTRYHDRDVADWHFFTLEVRRDSEDSQRLTGRIRTRFWSGSDDNTWPGACGELAESQWGRRFDVTIEMPAEGTFDGASFSFGGLDWAEKGQRCVPAGQWYNYHLDQFDGVLADGGRIIEAVVNDGARTHNQPQQLQRISCL